MSRRIRTLIAIAFLSVVETALAQQCAVSSVQPAQYTMNGLNPFDGFTPGWYFDGLDCCEVNVYLTPNDYECDNAVAPSVSTDVPWLLLQGIYGPGYFGNPGIQFLTSTVRQYNPYTIARTGHILIGASTGLFTVTVTQDACVGSWCQTPPSQSYFILDPTTKTAYKVAAIQWGTIAAGAQLTAAEVCPGLIFLGPATVASCVSVAESTALVANAMATMYDTLTFLDPVDPNYKVIATPSFPSIPLLTSQSGLNQTVVSAFNALQTNLIQQVGFQRALLTSINRVQGAQAAGDQVWFGKQIQAAGVDALKTVTFLKLQNGLQANLESALSQLNFPSMTISASTLLNFDQGVANGGLSEPLGQQLLTAGFSLDQINLDTAIIGTSNPMQPFIFPGLSSNLDASNQSLTAALSHFLADRNGDGLVNCEDVAVVKKAFGTNVNESDYSPSADVNGDGIVNILDLVLVTQQLPAGTRCQ